MSMHRPLLPLAQATGAARVFVGRWFLYSRPLPPMLQVCRHRLSALSRKVMLLVAANALFRSGMFTSSGTGIGESLCMALPPRP